MKLTHEKHGFWFLVGAIYIRFAVVFSTLLGAVTAPGDIIVRAIGFLVFGYTLAATKLVEKAAKWYMRKWGLIK